MNTTNQFTETIATVGKPKTVPDSIVAEIRRRAATETAWGCQKVIAIDLGLSRSFVNQVIRGYRRKIA